MRCKITRPNGLHLRLTLATFFFFGRVVPSWVFIILFCKGRRKTRPLSPSKDLRVQTSGSEHAEKRGTFAGLCETICDIISTVDPEMRYFKFLVRLASVTNVYH